MMALAHWLWAVGIPLAVALGWAAHRLTPGSAWPWPGLVVGIGAFVASGVVQNALVAPVALAIHRVGGVGSLVPASAWEALYYGLAAGIAQEVLKLAGLAWFGRRRGYVATALALGAGFAAAEVAFVGLSALVGAPGALPAQGAEVTIPLWERGTATIFHLATAVLLALGLASRRVWSFLVLAVVLHGLADGAVEFFAMAGGASTVAATAAFEAAFFVYSVLVLALALRGARTLRAGEGRMGA